MGYGHTFSRGIKKKNSHFNGYKDIRFHANGEFTRFEIRGKPEGSKYCTKKKQQLIPSKKLNGASSSQMVSTQIQHREVI